MLDLPTLKNIRMTTFIKTKFKKSDDQTNISDIAANIRFLRCFMLNSKTKFT